MMNLVSRCSERTPAAPSSNASESPGKIRHESQTPLSPQTEKYDRAVRPVACTDSSSCSEWKIDKTWSSKKLKSDELTDDRTERPVVCSQRADQFVIEDDETNSCTEAESDLSLGSRSFLHRVNDQVQKRQKQSSQDATKGREAHSVKWGRIMSSTLESSVFMGEELLRQLAFHQNTEDLSMKQMFDISEKLISEQSDEINGVKSINWEDSSWKYLSLVMNKSSVFSAQKSTYSQILYSVLERRTRTLNQIWHGKTD